MTDVTLTPMSEGYIFECSGHAGYAEKGGDIVCAGISALCMALTGVLAEMRDEDDARILSAYHSDGFLSLEAEPADNDFSKERFHTAFRTVMAGFGAIEALYPDYITVAG